MANDDSRRRVKCSALLDGVVMAAVSTWFKEECEDFMHEEIRGCIHCNVLLPRHDDVPAHGQGGSQCFEAAYQDIRAVASLQEQRYESRIAG